MANKYSYLRNGEKIRVLGESDGVVFGAVQITYETMWGDNCETAEDDGPIVQVRKEDVFASPPTKILSDKVVRLNTTVSDLESRIAELRREVSTVEKDARERMGHYTKASPVLKKLDEFIRGDITHYFIHEKHCTPRILTVEETIKDDYSYRPNKGRLLALSVTKKKAGLVWTLCQYSDGSGLSSNECTPCTSHEEALKLGQQWINEQVTLKNHNRKTLEFAEQHKLTLPEGYIEAIVEAERNKFIKLSDRERRKRAVDKRQKEVEWAKLLS